MSLTSARSTLEVDHGNEPKIDKIGNGCQWWQWAQNWQNWHWMLMMAMSPKLAKKTMGINNGDGAKIDKFNNVGENKDGLENIGVLNSWG
jgi:hypothetical protein